MRLSVVVVIVCALLSISPVLASAQDTEPAASVRAAAEDSRLDQKITYRCEAKRLDEVLPEIARQTGVVIGVDPSKRFWSVRQRKVTLFIKDMPLREFMNQLTTLLDYHFTRQGKPGEYTYTLWQDVRGRNREQAILKAQVEMRLQHRRLAIEETLRDAELALAMSPEEAKAIEETNPWLAYLAGNPRGRAYAELLRAIPPEYFYNVLEAKRPMSSIAGFSRLQPEAQEALRKLWSQIDFQQTSPNEQEPVRNIEDARIIICDRANFYLGSEAPLTAPFFLQVLADSRVVETLTIARSDVPVFDSGASSFRDVEEMRAREMRSRMLRGIEQDVRRTDPDLKRIADYAKKTPAPNQSPLAFELETLADSFDIDVMYEHYPNQELQNRTDIRKRELAEVLDDITSQYQVDWEKSAETLRFRRVDWAERRSWEIPPDWIAYWLNIIESDLKLGFDALSDVVLRLTDTQIERNFGVFYERSSSSIDEPALVSLFRAAGMDMAISARGLLEMHGRLNPGQRGMLWSSDGLSLGEVAGDPLFSGAETIGDIPLYQVTLLMSTKEDPDTKTEETFMSMKYSVWLDDLPETHREQVMPHLSEEVLAKADTEPIDITVGPMPLFHVDREQVKLALEEWRKAKEQAAAKRAQESAASDD